MRRLRRVRQELLRVAHHRAHLLRHLRADGAVRARQRGRRRAHEAPRRVAQAGERL